VNQSINQSHFLYIANESEAHFRQTLCSSSYFAARNANYNHKVRMMLRVILLFAKLL